MVFNAFIRPLPRRGALPLMAALGLLAPSPALADIMLYPTRVVIEGGTRSAQVEIVNRGEEPETYRIGIVNRRMTELGEIVPVDTPMAGEQFADEMIRYTPRQITLQPGASQTVRISIRKPADLSPGEYRSHMQFDRVPDAAGLEELDATSSGTSGEVSIQLTTLIGASIPVIVRHGQTSANVTLDALRVERGQDGTNPVLSFTFRREGNRSVYGDLVATYTAPGKEPVLIGSATGIAVYAPNGERIARLLLTPPEGVTLEGGQIHLRYRQQADAGGALIAEAAVQLP